jgi:alkanesulfonate monooxygenase SsuD/methylene tetrahydromethanopterin reductase-like flavin-dependent oxidoreductase (luciferase family)
VKLGVLVETEEGLDWAHWRQTFHAAERLGFDSIWVSDHLDSPWTPGRNGLDPFAAVAVALAETSRIRVGTLVSPITFHQVAILARLGTSLHALAPGRFVLGLGLGWNREEHATHGLPFPPFEDRASALKDALDRLHGVPILLGGSGASTLRLAAERADAWNVTTASPERFAELRAQIATTRQVECSIAAGVLIGRDAAELSTRAEQLARIIPPLREQGPEQLGWIAGTPETVVAQLRALKAAGVELAIVGHYDLDHVATLGLIASDVLPYLR